MSTNINKDEIYNRILQHFLSHPRLQIRDVLKFIHQGAFGCEHMVRDDKSLAEYIRGEYSADNTECTEIEMLSDEYSRVPLFLIGKGLSPETLGRLFYLSSKKETDGVEYLTEALDVFRELTENGALLFDDEAVEVAIADWTEKGYPALHHSEEYRGAYLPSYRVIANEYIGLLPLFILIDKAMSETDGSVTLAIEGGSASGKTTLAALLESVYGCTVFHMDDFFLRPEQRTAERFAEIGGNVDRERFLSEVLIPLEEGKPFSYRPFDCSRGVIGDPIAVSPTRLRIVEGAYSMHPELRGHYNISVYLDISAEYQRRRILKRNSPFLAERFFNEWIPLENKYFLGLDIKNMCDILIET